MRRQPLTAICLSCSSGNTGKTSYALKGQMAAAWMRAIWDLLEEELSPLHNQAHCGPRPPPPPGAGGGGGGGRPAPSQVHYVCIQIRVVLGVFVAVLRAL